MSDILEGEDSLKKSIELAKEFREASRDNERNTEIKIWDTLSETNILTENLQIINTKKKKEKYYHP